MSQVKASSTSNAEQINIVMVQDVFQVGDIKNNADKILQKTKIISKQGADLVVFPELALVGYPPEDLLHRQGFLHLAKQELQRIQQGLKGCIGDTGVILGLPYLHAGKLYNAAVYLKHGTIMNF